MDILAYELLVKGLKDYNETMNKPFGNAVVSTPPSKPTYPLTIVGEIRNVSNARYNTCYDRVASVGYSIRIYATNKGKFEKIKIAREIAKMVDTYLSSIGLNRTSYNVVDSLNDDALSEIVMTYTGNLHENRRNFI